MEYSELSDYEVPEGHRTDWTPVVRPGDWHDDPRRLSWDHENHLAGNVGGSWIGSVLKVPDPYDSDALHLALRAWLMRHEALRSTVRRAAGGSWSRSVAPREAIDVVPVEQGHGTAEANLAAVTGLFESVSPAAWPHLQLVTVHEPGGDGFLLGFGADHSVMDAYSQLAWFGEIVDLYRHAVEGTSLPELAIWDVGSHLDHSELDRARGEVLSMDDQAVVRWRDFLGSSAPRFPSYPAPSLGVAPVTDGSLPQHSLSTWVANHDEAAALGSVCRDVGVGLQAGALGALALGAAADGADELRFVMPMHTRHDPRHVASVGWYVGCAPVRIDLRALERPDDVISRTATGVNAGKDLVATPLPRIVELLGLDDHPHFVISYVDTRHVPGSGHWAEWQARALRSEAFADDEVYFWIIRSREGINISARYPRTHEADTTVRDLTRAMRSHLLDLGRGSASRDRMEEGA